MRLRKPFFRKNNAATTVFLNGFPSEVETAVINVVNLMPKTTCSDVSHCVSKERITYSLDSVAINFPVRIYFLEINEEAVLKMSAVEKTILHCIYSRSCDGHVREKHVKELLSVDLPEWVIPYIVKICDEYVIEILQAVYEKLKDKSNNSIKRFCINNRTLFI